MKDASDRQVITSYLYDHQHRLKNMYVKRGVGIGSVMLAHYDYNTAIPLGKNGNRRSAMETIGGDSRTVHYEYDHLYRLTKETILPGATPTGHISYTARTGQLNTTGYDLVGNRRSRDVSLTNAIPTFGNQTFTYDKNDRLTGTGNVSDANGNTLLGDVPEAGVKPTSSHVDEYDYDNRLIRRSDGTTTIEVVYDGDGNRVLKRIFPSSGGAGATNYFVVDTLNPSGYAQVLEEWKTTSANTWEQTRSYLHGHDLISQTQIGNPNVVHYYGYDGHGNVRFLIDSSATIADTYTYDAFGTLINKVGSTPNDYLYCGEQWDADLGFYYLRARYMNASSGRFWTMDSYEGNSQDPQTLHKYLYAHADPVNGLDPSGHALLADLLATTAMRSALMSMAIGAPFRAYKAARQFADGVALDTIAYNFTLGVAIDGAIGAALPGLFSLGSRAIAAPAGQAFTRAANSVWNMLDVVRGRAIEQMILGRVASTIQAGVKSFPVIDDFFNGVATSIKSIDLGKKTYQTVSGLRNKIVNDAFKLSHFQGAARGGYEVLERDIEKRVLVVVMESGRATQAQIRGMIEAVQRAKIDAPFVEIVFKFIP